MNERKIMKRNGGIVLFNSDKISIAIKKAIEGNGSEISNEEFDNLVSSVLVGIDEVFVNFTPNVENVQDIVEKKLMEAGHYDVAKGYILYRRDHEKLRQQRRVDDLKKLEKKELKILKRSGLEEDFDPEKLRKTLSYVIRGYESLIDVDAIVEHCETEIYGGMDTTEISRCLLMACRSWVEQGNHYSHIASRLLLNSIYGEIFKVNDYQESFDIIYRKSFIEGLKRGVEEDILDSRLLDFDLEQLAEFIEPGRDDLLMYMGLQTLTERYFLRYRSNNNLFETPQAFWMRVAMGMAINEKEKEKWAKEFYNIMSKHMYTPSTPTLFHAGTTHPQLSSCYLTTIEDDLSHIFKCIGDNAQLSKWSGGIGNDWTNVRSTGSFIDSNRVNSNGIIPFLKIADDTTAAINRSGKRRGATCAYCETWHLDIEDFLDLRKNTGDDRRRTHDMNTANWIPDLFMKRVINNGDWTLFSPNEVSDLHETYGQEFEEKYVAYERLAEKGKIKKFKKMKAGDLWRKMITALFETGHPWLTFKDPCNIRSPQDHVGVIHSSNLCTEITLNTSSEETAVCNLGSINLVKHIREGSLDSGMIEKTVTVAMRMLDNVIDLNFYPTVEASNSNLKHRPVGIGVMGFQDALYMQEINFDSEECLTFADESMEIISYYALLASSELAMEKGKYPSFSGSKWDRGIFPVDTISILEEERGMKTNIDKKGKLDWSKVRESVKKYGMRNSNCIAIAPTATISTIVGVFPTIEPAYKNIYVKANQTGDFTVVNQYLIDDLKKRSLFDFEILGKIKYHDGSIQKINEIPEDLKRKYKEVFEIESPWLIRAAALRGKWIDQSQSLNIFFSGTSGKELSDLYMYAWSLGIKTTYYLRTLAISQVEKSTVDINKYGTTHKREGSAVNTPVQTAPVESKLLAAAPTININSGPTPSVRIDGPECEACQ